MAAGHLEKLLRDESPIPAAFRSQIRQASALVDEVVERSGRNHAVDNSVESVFVENTRLEGEATIAILGARGSGKTTLLVALCRQLLNHKRHLVLPVIRPELFGPNDSILTATVGAIAALLTSNGASLESAQDGRATLDILMQRGTRAATITSAEASEVLSAVGTSLGQYVADRSAIVRERALLGSTLADLFRSMSGARLDGIGPGAVVIPIDDADLVPGHIARLLSDIRLLGSLPFAVPIMCAERTDLAASLESELSKVYLLPDDAQHRRTQTALQLAKTLPPNRVLTPPSIPAADRLQFSPFGESRSLQEALTLLDRAINKPESRSSLGAWLSMPEGGRGDLPSRSRDWLPGTPRALEHLWQVVDSVEGAKTDVERADLVRRILEEIAKLVPILSIDLQYSEARRRLRRPHVSGTIVGEATWPRLGMGVSADPTWRNITQSGKTRIAVRACAGLSASVRLSVESDDETRRVRLDREGVGCALLAQALLGSDLFLSPRPLGPFYVGWNEHQFLQSVRLGGLSTDDHFFLLPMSNMPDSIFRSLRSWNACVRYVERSRRRRHGDDFLAALIGLIAGYWVTGNESECRVKKSRKGGTGRLEDALTEAAARYLEFASSTRGFSLEEFNLEEAYCQWFEVGLAFSFHDAILSKASLSVALEIWQATIAAGPRGQSAFDGFREAFDTRLEAIGLLQGGTKRASGASIGASWVYGYRSLLENAYSERLEAIRRLREEYLERTGPGSHGRDAIEESVGLTHESTSYEFSSHRTAEAIADYDSIMAALDTLRS